MDDIKVIGRRTLKSDRSRKSVIVYETPIGTRVINTKSGIYPLCRDGQLRRTRRFLCTLDNCEVWERKKKRRRHEARRVSISLQEIEREYSYEI
jgi:hypothetical protein